MRRAHASSSTLLNALCRGALSCVSSSSRLATLRAGTCGSGRGAGCTGLVVGDGCRQAQAGKLKQAEQAGSQCLCHRALPVAWRNPIQLSLGLTDPPAHSTTHPPAARRQPAAAPPALVRRTTAGPADAAAAA